MDEELIRYIIEIVSLRFINNSDETLSKNDVNTLVR